MLLCTKYKATEVVFKMFQYNSQLYTISPVRHAQDDSAHSSSHRQSVRTKPSFSIARTSTRPLDVGQYDRQALKSGVAAADTVARVEVIERRLLQCREHVSRATASDNELEHSIYTKQEGNSSSASARQHERRMGQPHAASSAQGPFIADPAADRIVGRLEGLVSRLEHVSDARKSTSASMYGVTDGHSFRPPADSSPLPAVHRSYTVAPLSEHTSPTTRSNGYDTYQSPRTNQAVTMSNNYDRFIELLLQQSFSAKSALLHESEGAHNISVQGRGKYLERKSSRKDKSRSKTSKRQSKRESASDTGSFSSTSTSSSSSDSGMEKRKKTSKGKHSHRRKSSHAKMAEDSLASLEIVSLPPPQSRQRIASRDTNSATSVRTPSSSSSLIQNRLNTVLKEQKGLLGRLEQQSPALQKLIAMESRRLQQLGEEEKRLERERNKAAGAGEMRAGQVLSSRRASGACDVEGKDKTRHQQSDVYIEPNSPASTVVDSRNRSISAALGVDKVFGAGPYRGSEKVPFSEHFSTIVVDSLIMAEERQRWEIRAAEAEPRSVMREHHEGVVSLMSRLHTSDKLNPPGRYRHSHSHQAEDRSRSSGQRPPLATKESSASHHGSRSATQGETQSSVISSASSSASPPISDDERFNSHSEHQNFAEIPNRTSALSVNDEPAQQAPLLAATVAVLHESYSNLLATSQSMIHAQHEHLLRSQQHFQETLHNQTSIGNRTIGNIHATEHRGANADTAAEERLRKKEAELEAAAALVRQQQARLAERDQSTVVALERRVSELTREKDLANESQLRSMEHRERDLLDRHERTLQMVLETQAGRTGTGQAGVLGRASAAESINVSSVSPVKRDRIGQELAAHASITELQKATDLLRATTDRTEADTAAAIARREAEAKLDEHLRQRQADQETLERQLEEQRLKYEKQLGSVMKAQSRQEAALREARSDRDNGRRTKRSADRWSAAPTDDGSVPQEDSPLRRAASPASLSMRQLVKTVVAKATEDEEPAGTKPRKPTSPERSIAKIERPNNNNNNNNNNNDDSSSAVGSNNATFRGGGHDGRPANDIDETSTSTFYNQQAASLQAQLKEMQRLHAAHEERLQEARQERRAARHGYTAASNRGADAYPQNNSSSAYSAMPGKLMIDGIAAYESVSVPGSGVPSPQQSPRPQLGAQHHGGHPEKKTQADQNKSKASQSSSTTARGTEATRASANSDTRAAMNWVSQCSRNPSLARMAMSSSTTGSHSGSHHRRSASSKPVAHEKPFRCGSPNAKDTQRGNLPQPSRTHQRHAANAASATSLVPNHQPTRQPLLAKPKAPSPTKMLADNISNVLVKEYVEQRGIQDRSTIKMQKDELGNGRRATSPVRNGTGNRFDVTHGRDASAAAMYRPDEASHDLGRPPTSPIRPQPYSHSPQPISHPSYRDPFASANVRFPGDHNRRGDEPKGIDDRKYVSPPQRGATRDDDQAPPTRRPPTTVPLDPNLFQYLNSTDLNSEAIRSFSAAEAVANRPPQIDKSPLVSLVSPNHGRSTALNTTSNPNLSASGPLSFASSVVAAVPSYQQPTSSFLEHSSLKYQVEYLALNKIAELEQRQEKAGADRAKLDAEERARAQRSSRVISPPRPDRAEAAKAASPMSRTRSIRKSPTQFRQCEDPACTELGLR